MKLSIIGAGISGLVAAAYAARCGMDVTVYERALAPGGVSTSWRRKGFLFEGGIHWLLGTWPGTSKKRCFLPADVYATGPVWKGSARRAGAFAGWYATGFLRKATP